MRCSQKTWSPVTVDDQNLAKVCKRQTQAERERNVVLTYC